MTDTSTKASHHQKGLLITTVGGLLFTLDIPLLRLAGSDQWTMIFVRGIFMFAAITAWWFWFSAKDGKRVPFINGGAGWIVVATNTLANLLFIAAVTKTTAANLVFILALNPIFAAVLAWLVLKERIPLWTWVAVFLSLVGVAIIVSDGLTTGTFVGDMMAVVVALCTAVGLTVVRKTGKNVVTSLATGSLISALVAYGWAAPMALSMEGWGWLALNGLIVMPLASGLIALGPRYLPSAEVAMFFLLDTVLTPLWIWLIFAELPTFQSFIGGMIVITTLLAHSIWRYRTADTASRAHRSQYEGL